METKTINLRDMPEDVVRKAKAYAALCGLSLKDFVIQAMEKAMEADVPLSSASSRAFLAGVVRKQRRQQEKHSKKETVSK